MGSSASVWRNKSWILPAKTHLNLPGYPHLNHSPRQSEHRERISKSVTDSIRMTWYSAAILLLMHKINYTKSVVNAHLLTLNAQAQQVRSLEKISSIYCKIGEYTWSIFMSSNISTKHGFWVSSGLVSYAQLEKPFWFPRFAFIWSAFSSPIPILWENCSPLSDQPTPSQSRPRQSEHRERLSRPIVVGSRPIRMIWHSPAILI